MTALDGVGHQKMKGRVVSRCVVVALSFVEGAEVIAKGYGRVLRGHSRRELTRDRRIRGSLSRGSAWWSRIRSWSPSRCASSGWGAACASRSVCDSWGAAISPPVRAERPTDVTRVSALEELVARGAAPKSKVVKHVVCDAKALLVIKIDVCVAVEVCTSRLIAGECHSTRSEGVVTAEM